MSTNDTSVVTAGAEAVVQGEKKMSYEKVLSVAKTFKARSLKLQKEVEKLKLQLTDAEKDNTISPRSSSNATNATIKSGEATSQALFWDTIGNNSPFQQRLAYNAVVRLISSLEPLNGAKFNCLRRVSISSQLQTALTIWKHFTMFTRWLSLDDAASEQQKVIKELETKHAKLKRLLARTHNANKQQIEDSNAFRKAQTEAAEELKANEHEKSLLKEQLQALDMQNAFKQDFEISIQKAAEEMARAHREAAGRQGGAEAAEAGSPSEQSSSPGTSPKYQSTSALQQQLEEAKEDSEGKDRRIASLLSQLAEQEKALHSKHTEVAGVMRELGVMRGENEALTKKLADEECARKEVELELEVTLKSRGDIIVSSREQGEEKQRKHEEEAALAMQLLQSQFEQAEKKLSAAQAALDASLTETSDFKKANEKLKRDNDEVLKLRGQIIDLRRTVKAFDASNKKRREREKEKRGASNRAAIAAGSARTAVGEEHRTLLVHRAAALEREKQSFAATMQALLDIAQKNVASSVPASVKCPTSPEYSRILAKLESKVASAKAALHEAEGTVLSLQPMQWESSKVELGPGVDIKLPVPLLPERVRQGESMLRWKLSSSAAKSLNMTLMCSDGTAQKLQSMTVSEHGLTGELLLVEKHCGSTLSIVNSSWSGLTVAYNIELLSVAHDEAVEAVAEQTARLEIEEKRHGRFKTACGLLFKLRELKDREGKSEPAAPPSLAQDLAKLWEIDAAKVVTSEGVSSVPSSSSASISTTNYMQSGDVSDIQTLSCESSRIKARDDQRIVLPLSLYPTPFELSWILEVPGDQQAKLDVGFAVMQRLPDGSTPTLSSYKRVRGLDRGSLTVDAHLLHPTATDVVVLLDNSYSMFRAKLVKYAFKIESLQQQDGAAASARETTSETTGSCEGDGREGGDRATGQGSDSARQVLGLMHELLRFSAEYTS